MCLFPYPPIILYEASGVSRGCEKLDDELIMVFLEMLEEDANRSEDMSSLLMNIFLH